MPNSLTKTANDANDANSRTMTKDIAHQKSDTGEGSVSKCSKITIADQQLKELGIFNIKFDSTQNIFGPNKGKQEVKQSEKKEAPRL